MKKEARYGFFVAILFFLISLLYLYFRNFKLLINSPPDLILNYLLEGIKNSIGAVVCGSVLFYYQCRVVLSDAIFSIILTVIGFFLGFGIGKLHRKYQK